MKVLIVDDEPVQLKHLKQKITKEISNIESVNAFDDPKKALLFLNKNEVDLLFLDIEMPTMNGFEFIEIAGLNLPPFIFTTAFSKYAVEAFKVNAIDYLLKPVITTELKTAIDKVRSRNNQPQRLESLIETAKENFLERLVVIDDNSHFFINFDEIICIEGSGSYASFHLINGKKITASRRLNFYWKKLESLHFIRPHQSYIANLKHVLSFSNRDGGSLSLNEGHIIPVSRRLRHSVKEQLGLI